MLTAINIKDDRNEGTFLRESEGSLPMGTAWCACRGLGLTLQSFSSCLLPQANLTWPFQQRPHSSPTLVASAGPML